MKTQLSAIALLFVFLGATADAQSHFSSKGTQSSTNVTYTVAPKGSTVEYIIGYGEKSPFLEIWQYSASTMITNALAAGWSNLLVSSTSAFSDGDTCLIYDVSADTWQRVKVMAPAAGSLIITNDLIAATTASALVAGDVVYTLTRAGAFPMTAAVTTTWTANGGTIWHAADGPALIQVKDLSTPTTNQMCIISGVK